jgi:hypothetical protein
MYAVNVIIWYILLSIVIAFIWMLTGFQFAILTRFAIACLLGWFKPILNKLSI